MSIKEELHELVDALPPREWPTARRLLAHLVEEAAQPAGSDAPRPHNADFFADASVEELAAQQGVLPVANADELRGDFWPEEESADEFVAAVRRWRREGDHA